MPWRALSLEEVFKKREKRLPPEGVKSMRAKKAANKELSLEKWVDCLLEDLKEASDVVEDARGSKAPRVHIAEAVSKLSGDYISQHVETWRVWSEYARSSGLHPGKPSTTSGNWQGRRKKIGGLGARGAGRPRVWSGHSGLLESTPGHSTGTKSY